MTILCISQRDYQNLHPELEGCSHHHYVIRDVAPRMVFSACVLLISTGTVFVLSTECGYYHDNARYLQCTYFKWRSLPWEVGCHMTCWTVSEHIQHSIHCHSCVRQSLLIQWQQYLHDNVIMSAAEQALETREEGKAGTEKDSAHKKTLANSAIVGIQIVAQILEL